MTNYAEKLNKHITENISLFKDMYAATEGKYFVRYSGENVNSWVDVSQIQGCYIDKVDDKTYEVRVIIGNNDLLVDVYDNGLEAESLYTLLLYSQARAEQEDMALQRQILEQAQDSVDSMVGKLKPDFSMN